MHGCHAHAYIHIWRLSIHTWMPCACIHTHMDAKHAHASIHIWRLSIHAWMPCTCIHTHMDAEHTYMDAMHMHPYIYGCCAHAHTHTYMDAMHTHAYIGFSNCVAGHPGSSRWIPWRTPYPKLGELSRKPMCSTDG
jgi:hypothetical protein